MTKRKESVVLTCSNDSVRSLVSAVGQLLPQTPTTSEPKDQEAGTQSTTLCPSVAYAIPTCTPQEFEDGIDDIEMQLIDDEESAVSPSLVFSAMLRDLRKDEDGGFSLMFQVPEQDKDQVAKLLLVPQKILSLVVVAQTPRYEEEEDV